MVEKERNRLFRGYGREEKEEIRYRLAGRRKGGDRLEAMVEKEKRRLGRSYGREGEEEIR